MKTVDYSYAYLEHCATEADMPAIDAYAYAQLSLQFVLRRLLSNAPRSAPHRAPHGVLLTAREDHRLGRFMP